MTEMARPGREEENKVVIGDPGESSARQGWERAAARRPEAEG